MKSERNLDSLFDSRLEVTMLAREAPRLSRVGRGRLTGQKQSDSLPIGGETEFSRNPTGLHAPQVPA